MGWRVLTRPVIWKATRKPCLIRGTHSDSQASALLGRCITSQLILRARSPSGAQVSQHPERYKSKQKVRNMPIAFCGVFFLPITRDVHCTVRFNFSLSLCVLFPLLLLSLFLFLFPLFFFLNCSFPGLLLCFLLPTPIRPHLVSSLPSFLSFLSLPLRLSWDRSSGLVAICCLFFFLWGWDQMASNRSSWSPWLPGWQSTWERHILQPGAVRSFLWGGKKIKPLPSYSHIYIFPKCTKTQTLFMFYIATYLVAPGQGMQSDFFYLKKKKKTTQKRKKQKTRKHTSTRTSLPVKIFFWTPKYPMTPIDPEHHLFFFFPLLLFGH